MLHDFQQLGERRRGYFCAETCEQSRERAFTLRSTFERTESTQPHTGELAATTPGPQSAFERWWRRNARK
jgi:hypothetical protein